ncbi:MAG TPA: hypothetical protein VIK14_12185 [Ignavibacteria bacterium]
MKNEISITLKAGKNGKYAASAKQRHLIYELYQDTAFGDMDNYKKLMSTYHVLTMGDASRVIQALLNGQKVNVILLSRQETLLKKFENNYQKLNK